MQNSCEILLLLLPSLLLGLCLSRPCCILSMTSSDTVAVGSRPSSICNSKFVFEYIFHFDIHTDALAEFQICLLCPPANVALSLSGSLWHALFLSPSLSHSLSHFLLLSRSLSLALFMHLTAVKIQQRAQIKNSQKSIKPTQYTHTHRHRQYTHTHMSAGGCNCVFVCVCVEGQGYAHATTTTTTMTTTHKLIYDYYTRADFLCPQRTVQ